MLHTYYELKYFIIIVSEIGFHNKHNNVTLLFNLIYSRSRYKLQSFIHGTMSAFIIYIIMIEKVRCLKCIHIY